MDDGLVCDHSHCVHGVCVCIIFCSTGGPIVLCVYSSVCVCVCMVYD